MMIKLLKMTLFVTFITLTLYLAPAAKDVTPMTEQQTLTFVVKKGDFDVDVHSVGELEASRSRFISSSIRGDYGKIVYLITDGADVKDKDLLVKMDPTPFEEKIRELESKLSEQDANIVNLNKNFEWEINQHELEKKTNNLEVELAELELNKVVNGDGPQEKARLKSIMKKARIEFEEINGYEKDLQELEKQGFLNLAELKQAQKKLVDLKEAYHGAKMQYEGYINDILPMLVKKAETNVKRAKIKQEEALKNSEYKIEKAKTSLDQAQQVRNTLAFQLQAARRELSLSEIRAEGSGMVVHREDYRQGQRRKPRVGDTLVINQAIMELPDLSSLVVKSRIREVDLFKIAEGKPATIQVDAYPNLTFSGNLISIGILAVQDQYRPSEEKFFEIKIAVNDADSKLRPGMTSRVIVHAHKVRDQILVPIQSIFEIKKNKYCFVCTDEGYDKRLVELGWSNEQWVEIKNGLAEGEVISLSMPPNSKI